MKMVMVMVMAMAQLLSGSLRIVEGTLSILSSEAGIGLQTAHSTDE